MHLLKTVFGNWQEEHYWHWMYRDRPGEGNPVIWVAEETGKIVGHYALVPVSMFVDGSRLQGSQSVDTATAPSFRGRGIFQTLAKLAYSDAASQGIAMSYGFSVAGDPAYVGFTRKLGWTHVGMMLAGVRVVNYLQLIRALFDRSSRQDMNSWNEEATRDSFDTFSMTISDYEVKALCCFDDQFESVTEFSSKLGRIIVERSARYLTWRYVNKPGSRYIRLGCFSKGKPVGYLVLRQSRIGRRMDGRIVDLVADGERAILALIRAASALLRTNVATLSVLAQEKNPYIEILSSAGFRFRRSHLPLIARVNNPAAVSENQIADPANWFIMHGDSDQI